MQGQLFTSDFLKEGIKETPVWKQADDATVDAFIGALQAIYAPFAADSHLNEPDTENDIIVKVLAALGWDELLRQNSASEKRREDIPDLLLFSEANAKALALTEKREDRRYRHGLAILESKRWLRELDRGVATDRLDPGTPSNQVLRYLSAVEVASDRAIRWAILTNGATWRLYYQGARSRAEEFFEINLAALVGVKGIQSELDLGIDTRHGIKLFLAFFSHAAFIQQDWDDERRTFHDYALAEVRRFEERVSQSLGQRVFTTVFPDLSDALVRHDTKAPPQLDREYLEVVREASLMLLYRLLFILYAEDRNLLPVRDKRYYAYSLRQIREDVRDKRDKNFSFSKTSTRIWDNIRSLFAGIAKGDSALGLPAYNGGLFEDSDTGLIGRVRVPDAHMAPVIDELSRRTEDTFRAWINYRDLSVQHLGGIYERLLEYRLENVDGKLQARPTSFARKGSGSYYTHDDLVKLLIQRTVGPLLDERVTAFDTQVESWKRKRELKPADWETLDAIDPASRILDIKVCDPAMGSGHFLVALVD